MSERFPYWNAGLARGRSEDFEVWGHLGCPEKVAWNIWDI